MGAGPLVPPQKLRNEWVSRIKGVGSFPWKEMVLVHSQDRIRSSHEAAEKRCRLGNSRAKVAMKASEAREALKREITKQTGQTGPNAGRVTNDNSVTFRMVCSKPLFPCQRGALERRNSEGEETPHPTGSHRSVRQVRPASPPQQSGENQLQDRVLQIRAYLRDIFAEAVDQDFLVKDPARKVTVQTQLRDTDRTILTWPQLRGVLSKLKLRDRILLELDMTNALRPGEWFALRWQCFNHAECTMRLVETVYKGQNPPWGKTRKSWGLSTFRKN
jgi:hypothetical protein